MSVTGISSPIYQLDPSSMTGKMSRRQTEDALGRQLEQALQNGDLAAAQQAYQKLAAFGTDNSGPFNTSKLQAEFQTLGLDLNKGDLASAQNDAANLGNDVVKHDVQMLHSAYSGGSPTQVQNALANLKNDYWAVFGTMPTMSDIQSLIKPNDNSSPTVNVQA